MKRSRRMSHFNPDAIKRDVKRLGISMNEFFVEADVNKSTWHRWLNGDTSPNTSTLDKLHDTIDRLKQERRDQ